ncbi:hypothetical protein I4U23_017025 [Adineta vaga]|nr:hypothetical protein I4U23_017025 [Adineta vaga]
MDECSICKNSLNSEKLDEITTSCGHTFHRECAQKRLDKFKKTNCQVCRRENTLGDALKKYKMGASSKISSSNSYSRVATGRERRELSPVASARPHSHHSKDNNENKWSCRKCQKSNHNSSKQCRSCGTYKRDDEDHSHQQQKSKKQESLEINAETWYETEMLRHKPNIEPFLQNSEHIIFHYKWNPYIWREQFQSLKSDNDRTRQLLRMTVMLNTIGTLFKKSYIVHDRQVKLKSGNTIKLIIYDHQSKLSHGGKIPILDTPYKSTNIEVIKSDGIELYERLVKNGRRPVLLQMTHWKYPGSEYKKYDGTQDENLFRQSDYFHCLNVDLEQHQQDRPKRFHCSSDCQLESLSNQNNIQRIDDFGIIYTSGITIFRQSEESGYAYMDKPLENVNILTITSYENPSLEKDMLSTKYAMATRKKIENIFSIAYHHKHDSLVLSNFSCDINKNPVDHIVQLFSSVIEQYAGFFKTIIFAIPDNNDQNHRSNSKQIFQSFEKLEGTINAITLIRKSNTIFGPYRILSENVQTNDIDICDLSPCQFGAKCRERNNEGHIGKFSHPPLCSKSCLTGKCDQTNNIVHMYSFVHRNQCQYGGECRQIDDDKHCQEYEHPPSCSAGGTCKNTTVIHLREYRHLPLCRHSQNCMDLRKGNEKHCNLFRHCALICSHRNYCADFHDKNHYNELEHSFPPPCPFTPYHCSLHNELIQASATQKPSNEAQKHCLDFSHVCRFGRNCRDSNSLHMDKSIHVARYQCPDGKTCTRLNQEEHLNSFTHNNILDIRLLCRHSNQCHDRHKLDHIIKFRHNLYSDDSGVVRYFGLNKTIDFVYNHKESIERINNYIENENWEKLPLGTIPNEILNFIQTVQPVHRCNPVIFESIILHGHVMSRSYMEKLKIPYYVANSVLQHSRIRKIKSLSIKAVEQKAKDYVIALVQDEFERQGFIQSDNKTIDPLSHTTTITVASLTNQIKVKENLVSSSIEPNDMEALKRIAIEIAQACINLHTNPAGIGYVVDKDLGTDRTIFSVLGPHLGHYYGDIVIIFKREILHHPDAEFSVQAGTSFASGKAYSWRPWLGDDPDSRDENIQLFHNSKIHASVPGYDYAAALELMAITSCYLNKNSMNIDMNEIIERWIQADSHQTIEAHLPQLVPLDYIDHIYMPKNIFEMLNPATRKSIEAVFRNRITITPHEGTDKPDFSFGPTPSTDERIEYQNFIISELLKRFIGRTKNSLSRPIQGAIITIPSLSFNDHYVLPLTISQAYKQYCNDDTKSLTDDTIFIYWQVMNGDMMLTLSNEQINLHEAQPNISCLVCYVAETPEVESNHYHEQYSYLNNSKPFSHDVIIKNRKYVAGSNTFYIGCNTGDFLTFCLQLQPSTGKVTLSHAGANSIYNRQIITYTFNKSQLDLTNLEFLHVSSGTRIVSIRNVMICFEKQMNLHPTYDLYYTKSTELVDGISSSSKSGSLIPCRENVNCLLQLLSQEKEHNSKYSHPCRFSELCRNHEPNLTHEPHRVSTCHEDENCKKLVDPFHRVKYRHTDLPDYLIPCRFQQKCDDKSDKHRIRYSHGEQVFNTTIISSLSDESNESSSDDRIPCKWGVKCRDIRDSRHCQSYSHPAIEKLVDHRIPCKWGVYCRDIRDSRHCQRYSHPQTLQSDEDDD